MHFVAELLVFMKKRSYVCIRFCCTDWLGNSSIIIENRVSFVLSNGGPRLRVALESRWITKDRSPQILYFSEFRRSLLCSKSFLYIKGLPLWQALNVCCRMQPCNLSVELTIYLLSDRVSKVGRSPILFVSRILSLMRILFLGRLSASELVCVRMWKGEAVSVFLGVGNLCVSFVKKKVYVA